MNEPNLVDFHCHLDLHADMQAAFDRCEQLSCTTFTVTTTPKAYSRNVDFAASTKHIKAALGLHPQLVAKRGGEIDLFEEFVGTTRYIGEIGLDASRSHYASFDKQKLVFDRALRLCAAQRDKIISIHSARCARQVLEALHNTDVCRSNVIVLHWFSAGQTEVRKAIELGCWFSVNQQMLTSETGRKLLAVVPRDRILTETDAPFMKVGEKTLVGGDVIGVLENIASFWKMDFQETRDLIASNATRALL